MPGPGQLLKSRRGNDARNALVLKWQRFARKVARDLCGKHECVQRLGLDEAYSAANVGLIRAAELWDKRKGVQFNTYAYWCMRQRIMRDALDQDNWLEPYENYNPPADFLRGWVGYGRDDDEGVDLHVAQEQAPQLDSDELAMVSRALGCLDERRRRIVELHIGGTPLIQIAPILRISKQRVGQLWTDALYRMKRMFGTLTEHESEVMERFRARSARSQKKRWPVTYAKRKSKKNCAKCHSG